MPLILTQKLHKLEYNDIVGEIYHYPKQYWSFLNPGEIFIYYHSGENEDHGNYYFGAGRIGNITPDKENPDHRYAEIIDFIQFNKVVPFKENGNYIEKKVGVEVPFFRAVRVISEEVVNKIITKADVEASYFKEFASKVNLDEILAQLNLKYQKITPTLYRRLVNLIDRPTSISRALKEKFGYRCQLCKIEGFEKKTDGQYCEAHHIIELHKLIPGSLITDNIIIVCSNCHKKLHYALVNYEIKDHNHLNISINGENYLVKRNIM